MRLAITRRFLRIPVRPGAEKVYFVFRKGTETVYLFEAELCTDFETELCAESPVRVYEADLLQFLGEELELFLYRRQAEGRHPMHSWYCRR